MNFSKLVLTALLCCSVPLQAAPRFADPLDTAAVPSALASRALVNALALAGQRLVAVGQRGHILYSDDAGVHWTQAAVPVSSDLVAVHFPSARSGWAVGHDGVVLHSADAGASWTRQRAGEQPLLGVWFADERHGYAVGAFNQLLATTDGGGHWTPWEAHADNPKALHLNAISQVGERLYIVGEQGLVLRLTRDHARFEALPTPYNGSFFGLTGQGDALIVYGLRGTALRSLDQGASWKQIDTGVQSGLTAACITADGAVLLASQGGQVLASRDNGATFGLLNTIAPGATFAMQATGDGKLVLAGLRGMRTAVVP